MICTGYDMAREKDHTAVVAVIDVGPDADPMDVERVRRRYEDGVALHRLLDIWPATPVIRPDGPGWRVQAYLLDRGRPVFDSGICDTLSEAADKCLEAMG